MEIIKRGTLPELKVYTTTCKRCETVFKFFRKEAEYIPDQRDGDCLKIACPVCNEFAFYSPYHM